MTIFGAAGDLTKRLVMPALYNLVRAGRLADAFTITGVDISDQTDESWRNSLSEMLHTGHERLPERAIIGPFREDFVDGRVMDGGFALGISSYA